MAGLLEVYFQIATHRQPSRPVQRRSKAMAFYVRGYR